MSLDFSALRQVFFSATFFTHEVSAYCLNCLLKDQSFYANDNEGIF